jgi:hypothetical protein
VKHVKIVNTSCTNVLWFKLSKSVVNTDEDIICGYQFDLFCKTSCNKSWLSCIKNIFDICGHSNIWNEQIFFHINWLKFTVERRLKDQYIQKWQSDIRESSKGETYGIFKIKFGFEKYLDTLPRKLRTKFIKFRTSNHHLPVETGRWCGTPKNEKTCHICKTGQIADEYHYLLECKSFEYYRRKYSTVNADPVFSRDSMVVF